MPKTSWFKHLWKWKKNKNKVDIHRKMHRTKRMTSFKIKKNGKVSVKAYDLNGKDISHYVSSSYNYNGVPGGFYVDTKKMMSDGYYS